MQKISPLKASLEAFNKFKITRRESNFDSNVNNLNTNPFGITFRGKILQMDVFETSKNIKNDSIITRGIEKVSKLTASAWTSSLNKIDTFKNSIKTFALNTRNTIAETGSKVMDFLKSDINLDFSRYSVKNLQKRPLSELSEMLTTEIKALEV